MDKGKTRAPSDELQVKIFSRWVRQKVHSARHMDVKNLVEELKDGLLLVALMEILSEKQCKAKMNKTPKMKPHMIDNLNIALNFVWECGVDMKIKASPEDVFNGSVKPIMALLWAIMLKYMKVGDDEEATNARDSILMWSQQQCSGHSIKVEDMTKSWDDGKALCAIINKNRPKLLPWESVTSDAVKNVELAMTAAEKYFGLEKYLAPKDFFTLDEKCMVVYVSEYFYGVAEQRKLDLAARAIGKVVKFTKENDAMKKDYEERAQKLKETLEKVKVQLNDRTIDNSMEGAKKRLDDFYTYKTTDKNTLIGLQLALEGTYNQLAMRLAQNKRPAYEPKGMTLKDIEQEMALLEKTEQERKIALHAELNRQIKLKKLNEQHTKRMEKLLAWVAAKKEYLNTREVIQSVSEAELQLRLLDAFDIEAQSVQSNDDVQLTKLTVELTNEKYYKIEDVRKEDATIEAAFKELTALSATKRPILQDHLARETFKEKVLMNVQHHVDKYEKIQAFIATSEAYLQKKESISSVTEARTQLSKLDAYDKDFTAATTTMVPPLKKLGEEIRTAKYETQYSKYAYDKPEEITNKETTVYTKFGELKQLSAAKREVLDDDLAREQFKDRVLMDVKQHTQKYNELSQWIKEKLSYLNTKEMVSSVAEASTQLSLLDTFDKDQTSLTESAKLPLEKLGQAISDAKYETKHSTWVYEKPEEVKAKETEVDAKWAELKQLSAAKREVLDDDLAREQFKDRVLMDVKQHTQKYNELSQWIKEKLSYLNTKEMISSVAEASTQLSLLDTFDKDQTSSTDAQKIPLEKLGQSIRDAKYETKLSSYVYPTPQELSQKEAEIESHWANMKQLSAAKREVLDDDLAREQFRAQLEMDASVHEDKHSKLMAWIADKEAYLTQKAEAISSVSAAKTCISLLEAYESDKKSQEESAVVALKTDGKAIRDAKYETKHSKYVYPQPDVVLARESEVDTKFAELTNLSAQKKKVLEEQLALELEKERLRLLFASESAAFMRFVSDCKENCAAAHFGMDLAEVEEYKATLEKSTSDLTNEMNTKLKGCKEALAKLEGMGVSDNQYAKFTLADLEGSGKTTFDTAIKDRTEAYEKELARLRHNDKLCKEFAAKADPFAKWISDSRDVVSHSTGDLDQQMKQVKDKQAAAPKDQAPLAEIKVLQEGLEKEGIHNNPHTSLNAKDLEVLWEQYIAFLTRKERMVNDEIEHVRLRGITQEQLDEIKTIFKNFDKDNSGYIDKKELKSCMYTLGEEKTKADIEAFMKQYGKSAKGIDVEGFTEIMIPILGVTADKAAILEGWLLINRGQEVAKKDLVELVMSSEDLEFFYTSCKKVGSDFDYKDWTNAVFSR